MTDVAKRTTPTGKVWRGRLEDSEECRQLLANPEFRAALEKARKSGRVSLEDSNLLAGVTQEELEAADAEIDRLLAEEDDAENRP